MNRSSIIVALLGVAVSTTNTIVVNASSIPAPSPATASDWADVADEAWGTKAGGGRSLEGLSDMQRRRLSTTAPTAAATTDTFFQGSAPTPVTGIGDPVSATISVTNTVTVDPPTRRLSSSVQRDLAVVSCSYLDIDRDEYKTQLDTTYCTPLEADPEIDTCEVKNLVLTCETTGPTPTPTGTTLTVDFDLDLVVKCSAAPCDADAAQVAVDAAAATATSISNGIAGGGTSIPTTSGGDIIIPASDITITEEVTSNAEKFSEWYPLSYVNGEDGNTCSNNGDYPDWLNTALIKSSLKECCEQNYSWAESDCFVDGGGNPASVDGYGEYYINYDYEADKQFCVKSCPEDTTGIDNCAGLATNWQVAAGLYTTAEACCDTFGWFGNGWDKEKCIYKSENGDLDGYVYVGSGKFFVPYSWEGCIQDNAANEDKYATNVQEFATQAECCSQVFSYVEEGKEVTGCCKGGTAC